MATYNPGFREELCRVETDVGGFSGHFGLRHCFCVRATDEFGHASGISRPSCANGEAREMYDGLRE
jgi:hypothetical protein